MAQLKVYLDTSVFSAYFDDRAPMRQRQTREFWDRLKEYERYASELVLEELNAVTDEKLRSNMVGLTTEFQILK